MLILTHRKQTAFENIVGKGETAHKEQFLLFQQFFLLNQITVSPFVHIFDIKKLISLFAAELKEPKIGITGKGLTLYQATKILTGRNCKHFQTTKLMGLKNSILLGGRVENIFGRGENDG